MNNENRVGKFLYFFPRLAAVAIFFCFVAITVLSNFDIVEPYLYPLHMAQGKIRNVAPGIIFGHYPHRDDVRALKRRGVALDVSLLNLSLPQELVLHEQLKRNAAKEGIEVYSFPLSYLNLDSPENRDTVSRVVAFIRQNKGKTIYIHCYLGRHRVKVVEDELRSQGVIR